MFLRLNVFRLLRMQSLDGLDEQIPAPTEKQRDIASGRHAAATMLPNAAAQRRQAHAGQRLLGADSDESPRAGRAAAATAVLPRSDEGPDKFDCVDASTDAEALEETYGPWWEDFVQVTSRAKQQCDCTGDA